MSWLAGNTAVAGALALLVVLAGWLLHLRPATLHLLWLCVLLKLGCPPLWSLDLTLPGAAAPNAATPAATVPYGPPAQALASAPSVAPVAALPDPALLGPPSVDPSPATWLTGAWLFGSAVVLLVLLADLLAARRAVRRGVAAPGWMLREVAAIAARLGVAAPEVRLCARGGPFVLGGGRPVLVLPPADAFAAMPRPARAAVLAHELAHVRRRDHWVAVLELVLAVAWWWHPLFWFARARLRQEAELACDAWALRVVPEGRFAYADALIAAVSQESTATSPAVLAARPGRRRAFERRLTMVLQSRKAGRWSHWAGASVLAGAVALVPATATAQRGEGEQVEIEIRINGVDVGKLDAKERRALLEALLQGKDEGAGERAAKPKPKAKPKAEPKRKPKAKADRDDGLEIVVEPDGEGLAIRGVLQEALGEARREIANDPDLRELGITDEVTHLLDTIGSGGDFDGALDGVIKGAMQGAGKLALAEIRADADLQRMGLTRPIAQLVENLLDDEDVQQGVKAIAKQAMRAAMTDVKAELRNDADLERLGIGDDLERLIDGMLSGKAGLDESLERIIEKAVRGAMREHGAGDGDDEPPAKAKAKPKPKRGRRIV